jgi:uncharacterized membrane protein
MKAYATAGLTVLAGVALFEVTLIPAVIIGGAAVLAPKYLPRLRRRLHPTLSSLLPRRAHHAVAVSSRSDNKSRSALAKLGIRRAVAKTITFRIIVTTLDFTTNYLVIGELTTAAGLSTFNLVAGPLFYLTHEAAWNYFDSSEGAAVDVEIAQPLLPRGGTIKISRALAKTITFRTIATIMDFTTNYVVVRDIATAAGLSAFAFVVGPFVYLGHEKVWDYYTSRRESTVDLLPSSKPQLISRTLKPVSLR